MKDKILEIERILHDLKDEEACIIEIKVLTDSMQPLINVQEKHKFLLSHKKPKVGDIVLYRVADKLYCHRVISEISGYYITKGDNCLFHDKTTISDRNVLGFLVLCSSKERIVNIIQRIKVYI